MGRERSLPDDAVAETLDKDALVHIERRGSEARRKVNDVIKTFLLIESLAEEFLMVSDVVEGMEILEHGGVQQRFIAPSIGIILIAAIGIFCNFNVALTVVTSKKLRNVSNYLIALNSIGDIGHLMPHFFTAYILLSGTNVTSAKTCFIIMALPLLSVDFTFCIMIWIGLDRILRIVLLNRYDRINKKAYLAFIVATSNMYGLTLIYIAYESVIVAPDAKLLCDVVTILNGEQPRKIHLYSQLSVSGTIVITYVVFWILLKHKHVDDVTTKLVARSVTAIVAVVLIFWVFTTVIVMVGETYLSYLDYLVLFFYTGDIMNLSCSFNFFILYALNSGYRKALRMQLSWIFPWCQTLRTQPIPALTTCSKQERIFTRAFTKGPSLK